MAQRSDDHGGLVSSRWSIRHRLSFCVGQRRHVLLVHKGEVVLELETEVPPGPLIVVIRSRSWRTPTCRCSAPVSFRQPLCCSLVTMFMSSGSKGGMSSWISRSVSLMSTTSASIPPLAPSIVTWVLFSSWFGPRSRQVKEETFADSDPLHPSSCVNLRTSWLLPSCSALCCSDSREVFQAAAHCLAHWRNCQFKVMSLCRA